ncbi:MAG: hypothetical protein QOH19_442 [Actinomycetota bacterium]|nr:hypothetical protein [Actinomycetota bacterium]
MAENRTQATGASVEEFLAAVEQPVRRRDGLRLLALMSEITGDEPEMWGPTIVGFGRYHYKYDSGREGDAAAVGFSPRKARLSLYGLTYGPVSAVAGPAGETQDRCGLPVRQHARRRRRVGVGRADPERLPARDHRPAPRLEA